MIGVKHDGNLREEVVAPPLSMLSREGAHARLHFAIKDPAKQVAWRAGRAVNKIRLALREISETRRSLIGLKVR